MMKKNRFWLIVAFLIGWGILGCGTEVGGENSGKLAEAYRKCEVIGASGEDTEELLILVRAYRDSGFPPGEPIAHGYDGCLSGCASDINCADPCLGCLTALVDAIYYR